MTPRALLLQHVDEAWKEAGIAVSFTDANDRVAARVERHHVEPASMAAVRALQILGCRTCLHRSGAHESYIYGFSESGSLCIEIIAVHKQRVIPRHRRKALAVALLGPDGVGKSTVLRLVKEWFAREAPFIDVTVRQWRPGLLPPLAALLGKGGGEEDGDMRPRRDKGNLQWLRLFYYFLDFLLGSWWKDREQVAGSRLIVYDRCALDMEVDPYRFALSSRRGTRLLWKLTPRPKKLILLFDTPERIARRKDDLREHEMAEQLESWLSLASEDEVHAIVRVDDGPREIANRVRDLFIESLADSGVSVFPPERPQMPPGQYAILPGESDPRFLIPLDMRETAAASLAIYNPQRRIAKFAKSILRIGLRLGIAQPLLRCRGGLGSLAKVQPFLSRAVGCGDIRLAVSLGTPGPNQKPTVQIMDRQGAVLGYAKVGRHARAIASIRDEQQALRTLASASFSTAVIPRLLDSGWIGSNYVLVQSTVPSEPSSGTAVPDSRYVRFLAELHGLGPSLCNLPFPSQSELAALRNKGFHYDAHLIESAAQRWCDGPPVPCGPAHGDFTPWNIRFSNGNLFVFDWETFRYRTPAGWDLFHYLVAGGVEVRGATPGAIYNSIVNPGSTRELIDGYFREIGSHPDCIAPLFVSYAANALRAGILDLRHDASEKDRSLQRTWAALLALFSYREISQDMAPEQDVAVSI